MEQRVYLALSAISDDEWRGLFLKLGNYARGVSRTLKWRTHNPLELPDGETVDSIVSKAVEKVLSGERRWDPTTDPSLEKYLMNVIDSLLNHLAESADNRIFKTIPETPNGEEAPSLHLGADNQTPGTEWLARPTRSPEELLIEQEERQYWDSVLTRLIDECAGDKILSAVLQENFDGCEDAGKIAEKLGLSVTDVYNANKRLTRRISKIDSDLRKKPLSSTGKD